MRTRTIFWIVCIASCLSAVSLSQSVQLRRTLVINGQSGSAVIYQIDGKSFLEVEALVRIANGSIAFQGDTIVLTLPAPQEQNTSKPAAQSQVDDSALSTEFIKASVASLRAVKEWTDTLTYAAQKGVPGDGRQIVALQDRATEAFLQAKAQATSSADQNTLPLLTSNYDTLKAWSDKLLAERRAMDTGKYSLSPELIQRDATYQKIVTCTKFLATVFKSGHFQDDRSCH